MTLPEKQTGEIGDKERDALYRIIFSRRDVRGQFLADPIEDQVLSRILYAAHYAPSVGFMQPWNFILIRSIEIKEKIHQAFLKAHNEAAEMFSGRKKELYRRFKLEGILESPVNICVTCDTSRSGPVVIGRTHIDTMDRYSSVCAIQNLWLAARAEGLGVGWVSIIDEEKLKTILDIPADVVPVGYLCIGKVSHFWQKPELESAGWLPRLALDKLVDFERWNGQPDLEQSSILHQIKKDADFPMQIQKK